MDEGKCFPHHLHVFFQRFAESDWFSACRLKQLFAFWIIGDKIVDENLVAKDEPNIEP